MRWKRKEPGTYVSGDYKVQGSGNNWTLYQKRTKIKEGFSKKEMQQAAEAAEDNVTNYDEIEQEEVTPTKLSKSKPDSVDSILASLRLEIDHLSLRIDHSSIAVKELSKTVEGLTQAVMLLAKHISKLK